MAKQIAAPKPSKNKLADAGAFVLCFGLAEAQRDDSNGADGKPKHEIVLTALQEGPGNQRDRRWYTREAVVNSEPLFRARKKLFVNHLQEGAPVGGDDLRNWCATLKETWIETMSDGKVARKVRLKIHEEWLWQRCVEAPEEIALSIEGSGAGKEAVVEGQSYMVIEKIWSLNATKFVTYPGNAKMGADLVESAAESTTEEPPMDWKALTEALLKEHRADIVAAIIEAACAPFKAKLAEAEAALASAKSGASDASKLTESVNGLKASLNATIDELRSKLAESDKKLDAYEVRERLRARKETVDRVLAESKLAGEARTPRFMERVYSLSERTIQKDGKDVVLGVEEQVKAEIEEQQRLVTADFGTVRASGAGAAAPAGDKLTEEEQQVVFNRSVFHTGPTLEEYRAEKAAEKAAKDKSGAAA